MGERYRHKGVNIAALLQIHKRIAWFTHPELTPEDNERLNGKTVRTPVDCHDAEMAVKMIYELIEKGAGRRAPADVHL